MSDQLWNHCWKMPCKALNVICATWRHVDFKFANVFSFCPMNFKGEFKSREQLFHLLGFITRHQTLSFLIQSHFHFTIHRRQLNFVTKRSEKRHEKVHSKRLTRKKLSIEKSEARSEKAPRRRKARIYPPSKVFSLVFKHHWRTTFYLAFFASLFCWRSKHFQALVIKKVTF